MLIKALCDYYNAQQELSDEPQHPDCFSEQRVSYAIMLTPEGDISDIIDKREQTTTVTRKGKNAKEQVVYNPITVYLPKRTQKPSIDSNIIEHRPVYIFGLNYEKDASGEKCFTPDDKTGKARKSNAAHAAANLEFFSDLTSAIARAYYNFLEKWIPENETNNEQLLALGNDYSSSYYYFALDGHPEIKLHEDEQVISKYVRLNEEKRSSTVGGDLSFCPIEGEMLPTARIHEKISGIKGGNAVGSSLVCINETAFESYGKTQSFNSCISEKAMLKYTSTLNSLLSDEAHHMYINKMTVVFFALQKNDKACCEKFVSMVNGDYDEEEDDEVWLTESSLSKIAEDAQTGRVSDLDSFNPSDDIDFYIVGFTPNSSRISQRFLVHNRFSNIMSYIKQHQADLRHNGSDKQIPLWKLCKELSSPKEKNPELPAALITLIFNAILNGSAYPEELLESTIRRIKTDSDDKAKHFSHINGTRIGIIKASLNRRSRLNNQKEEITMALNTENRNPAYLCGRLFAVLEYTQRQASSSELNRTIKDAYFTSACSKPAIVFPKLIMLSQHHIEKITRDSTVLYLKRLTGEIISMLSDEFPGTLPLEEQGKYIIGYYQQNKALYTARPKTSGDTPDNNADSAES